MTIRLTPNSLIKPLICILAFFQFASVHTTATDSIQNGPLATVTLEEFGDYQCPPCAALHPILKQLQVEYGSRLNLVFRNFPLGVSHRNALAAAKAAEAARLQHKFWQLHDFLFEHQKEWAPGDDPMPFFMEYARRLGIDLTRFRQDYAGLTVKRRISQDLRRAAELRLDGTPTLLLDGKALPSYAVLPQQLRTEIEAALKRKSSANSLAEPLQFRHGF
ncbi:MAG: DsbA family protein [Pyrinomonadaceae bacterium]